MIQPVRENHLAWLGGIGIVTAGLYAWVCHLSQSFAFGSDETARPLLLVLVLFGVLFALYLLAVHCAARAVDQKRAVQLILLAATAFRVVMLYSEPIQEVDIYRYVWDGAVSNLGISPYRYSPDEVVQALAAQSEEMPRDGLARVAAMCKSNPSLKAVLDRVHWRRIKTVYPPTSQFVFAVVDRLTPIGTPVDRRILVMRIVLVGCDLVTIYLVLCLLTLTQLPLGLVAGYAWCPLLIKECANSGHLDSIVVLLTTWGLLLIARAVGGQSNEISNEHPSSLSGRRIVAGLVGSFALALGVGAKIYPIVLLPWLIAIGWRRQWLYIALPAVFMIGSWVVMQPMLGERDSTAKPAEVGDESVVADSDALDGLTTFTQYWEMNDFLFLIAVENLKPDKPQSVRPWFAVVPNAWRLSCENWAVASFGWEAQRSLFFAARLLTGILFGAISCYLAWSARRRDTPAAWLEAAFLTIAWFWLLSPTQNPWYWTWVLPLLPLMRSRIWWVVSGLVLTYYLRFWFEYHFAGSPVWGTAYVGTAFFDYVVTWLEFGPWFVALVAAKLWSVRRAAARSN